MFFKNQKVWVAKDDKDALVTRGNRVLVKYRKDQEQEYWVNPENLSAQESAQPAAKPRKPAPKALAPDFEHGENTLVIHTDGASSGNPGPSGIGAVFRWGSHEKEISEPIGNTTNNVAELTAIYRALGEVKKTDVPVRLYTDSQYALGVLSLGWKAKKNEALIRSIRQIMKGFSDLRLIRVKGHADDPENCRADELAREAISGKRNREI
jgi:ribonuclease HI